jgi:phage-related protein
METFAPLIERAGLAVANLGENFGEWMQEAQATGRLNEIIQTMLDTLSTLGGIVQNIGAVFGAVFSAANESGGGLLGVIENLTGRLADFFNSAKGQEALSSFFSALSSVADAVVPIILELASAFGEDLAPHIATIAQEVGPSLRDLVRELGDAIGGIDVKTLAEGFADVLDAVIPLIEPIGNIISWFSQIEGLVPVLVAVLFAWAAAQWALNIAMYANPILLIIMLIFALIAAIALIIINWDSVSAALVSAWEWIKEKAVAIWGAIADFFVDLWDTVAGFFVGIWESIKGFFVGVWNSITNTVVGIWNAIKAFFVGIWNAIVSHARNQVNGLLAAIGWLASLPGKVAGWFQGVYNAAKEKLSSLVNWVKDIPGKIMDALGNLGSLLKDAGKAIIDGLLDGLKAKFGEVQDTLGSLTDMLPDWKGPAERDKTILGPAGEMVIGGFVDGLERAIPTVQRALAGLTSDIGLQVDGSAAPASLKVDATASLSEDDRALLRELAEARNRVDVRLGANLTEAARRENAMAVA